MRTGLIGTGLIGMLLIVAGCTQAGARPDGAGGSAPGAGGSGSGEPITYATAACYGTCPVYRVTIRPDGSGTFEGAQHTAVTGTRPFAAGPDAYRRFAAMLAPHRPAGERLVQMGSPDCRAAPTDMPSTEVRWGTRDHLLFYAGCRMGNERLADALAAAPDVLPIAAFVGKR